LAYKLDLRLRRERRSVVHELVKRLDSQAAEADERLARNQLLLLSQDMADLARELEWIADEVQVDRAETRRKLEEMAWRLSGLLAAR